MEFKDKRNVNNVINLDSERRRKQARRQEWRATQKKTSTDSRKTTHGTKPHWTMYLQFFLFIAFLAYALQQCR